MSRLLLLAFVAVAGLATATAEGCDSVLLRCADTCNQSGVFLTRCIELMSFDSTALSGWQLVDDFITSQVSPLLRTCARPPPPDS